MTYGRALAVGTTIALLGLIGAPAGWAHDGVEHEHLSEHALRQAETRVLGLEHAAEHARTRRLERRARARWRHMSAAQRRRVLERRRQARRQVAHLSAAADPATDGRWTGRFPIPVVGVHAVVLPTGKVMWFSRLDAGSSADNEARAYLWDPSKPLGAPSAIRMVTPPVNPDTGKPVNLWCAGQSLLADGQLLVTGGNLAFEDAGKGNYKGLNRIYTFDPWTERWTEQPRMAQGRWYPSQTLLPDGRTLVTAGRNESGSTASSMNLDIELFTPPAKRGGQGTITKIGQYGSSLPGSPVRPEYYPHWFVMPNGAILNAGPHNTESWALALSGTTLSSADRPGWARVHLYGTGVLLPGGPAGSTRVAQIGGFGWPGVNGDQKEASPITEVFDEAHPTSKPLAGPSLVQARAHHNTVLLPDGSMVSVGGGYGSRNNDLRLGGPEHLPIEIWNPATNTWRLGPAQVFKRAYHSTAVLLPDGRVVSAGDDRDQSKPEKASRRLDVAEIYEPAYLFKPGPRPAITAAPGSVKWNQPFSIQTSSPIKRAVLMAPGATTHANDMQQRHVELRITPNGSGANLIAPPSANVAPPGYYMLFALSATGKPSVAKWVRLGNVASAPSSSGDTTAPRFSIARVSKKLRRALKKGLRLVLDTNEGGVAKVALSVSGATARKTKLKRHAHERVKVGGLKQALPSGESRVTVKFTAKARKAFKKLRRVKLRVGVGIVDASGNRARHAKTVKLKR